MYIFAAVIGLDLILGFVVGRISKAFEIMLILTLGAGIGSALLEQLTVYLLTDRGLAEVAMHLLTGVLVHVALIGLIASRVRRRRLAASAATATTTAASADAAE